MKWTKNEIAAEILHLHQSGGNLAYSQVLSSSSALLRAAIRVFGNWEAAVTFAGLDYDSIRQYKRWSRKLIMERITELHAQGADLSWSSVSREIDPQLAAAAIKAKYYGSWRGALEAAGLDYDAIRRYQEWDSNRVIESIRQIEAKGENLNAKAMQTDNAALITAARRQFHSWHRSLTAAGIDYRRVVKRAPFKRGLGRRQNKHGGVRLKETAW